MVRPGASSPSPSTDATLSTITYSPAIAKKIVTGAYYQNYTATVGNSFTSISVTPVLHDPAATVQVNGILVTSGTPSAAIRLSVGINIINTVVTAQDGITTKTYSLSITRQPSADALLTSITFSPAIVKQTVTGADYQNYTATVANSFTSISITPLLHDTTASVQVNGLRVMSGAPSAAILLKAGVNIINTVVTAQDGITTKTYSLSITRQPSTDAALTSITYSPAIPKKTVTGAYYQNYTATVSNTVTSISVTPVLRDAAASVQVNGVMVASGTSSAIIPLNAGVNIINTVVTAQDGITTKTYSLSVTRQPSIDASLTTLTFSPAIPKKTVTGAYYQNYTATVSNTISSISVTPVLHDATAKVQVNGVTVASGTSSAAIPLNAGVNIINTVVTAQDGITTKTYSLSVTRLPSTDASLTSISYSPAIVRKTVTGAYYQNYTATVSNTVTSISVTPVLHDATASVRVNGIIVVSGTSSAAIPLNTGVNIINTVVTAQDGVTTQTYSISITRQPPADASLTSINYSPAIVKKTVAGAYYQNYTATVGNSFTSISVTPVLHDPAATVQVNGVTVTSGAPSAAIQLSAGINVINTVVTAQDGLTAKTYSLSITRQPSTNAFLTSIAYLPGIVKQIVTGAYYQNYTAAVSNAVTAISVIPVLHDTTANVQVNGVTVASGTSSATIPLNAGVNIINTVVTAQDGITTKTYSLSITRQPSADAGLANLSLSDGSISPAFETSVTSYTATVANSIKSVSVMPLAHDSTASVQVNGAMATSGTASAAVPLNVGVNNINIVVTAQDGATTATYSLSITRQPSADAGLANLSLNDGSLTPAFETGVTGYSASVANSITSISVTPLLHDTTASVKVNGITTVSGTASSAIPLSIGANAINVVVTAQDGVTIASYNLNVTRQLSADAGLANLLLSDGSLAPAFETGVTSYTASVANGITSISITPLLHDTTASVQVNGITTVSGIASPAIPLSIGVNTINVVVTAQDGVTATTYSLRVTRLSADAGLSNLSLSDGLLTPSFETGVTSYTTSVANSTTSISITPLLHDTTASIQVNGIATASGSSSAAIPLSVGVNIINTVVTAQDGIATTTYSLSVTRQPSADAGLANLSLSGGSLTPSFETGVTSYTASVANSITSISVTPFLHDTTASVQVNGIAVVSGMSSATVPLNVGVNVINVIVTAQDGVTTTTYSLRVTRLSADAGLSNLSLSDGILTPSFETGVTSYTTSVANSTTSISIAPLLHDTTASVQVNGVMATSGISSAAVPLSVGVNIINVVVTAQDGIATTTYSLSFTRQPSADAGLANLSLSDGSLTPLFETGATGYTSSVANSITSISVTPLLHDTTASVQVNGIAVGSGMSSSAVPLNVGVNIINTMVTAQDGITTITYSLSVTRQPSADAGLANLSLSDGSLTPAFETGVTGYTASVANSITSISVTPLLHDTTASVQVNGVIAIPGTASSSIPLSIGDNIINVVVTAQDSVTTTTYSLNVTRQLSADAGLSSLSLSDGSLTPAFETGVTSYAASVANSITSISVTPLLHDTTASVQVNGVMVVPGTSSATIPLNTGVNIINTVVTAQDGISTKTYSVSVSRQPSADAGLSNLSLSDGSLTPAFETGVTGYTASVANSITSISVTPLLHDITASVQVNGIAVGSGMSSPAILLNVGENIINTVVTAQDGITTTTYSLGVTRQPSADAGLANLSLSDGSLTPSFETGVTGYTASVANSIASISVTPLLHDTTASVQVNGVIATSGMSSSISLNVGENIINIVVTAQDGITTTTYSLSVTRQPSADAGLANLSLSDGSPTPAFETGVTSYTASAANNITSISVTPLLHDTTASVQVNAVPVTSGTPSAAIRLNVGINVINTVVTAQDGITTTTYSLSITRQPSADAGLSNLSLSDGLLTPSFETGVTSYIASVANSITSISVTPLLHDTTASVQVNGLAVASGTPGAVPLNIGVNVINVVVTAQDSVTTTTYSLSVTRLSADAGLSNLSLSDGVLTPLFEAGVTSYTTSVANSITSISITPLLHDTTASVQVNGIAVGSGMSSPAIPLSVGENIINTVVTAQDGITTTTYSLSVYRQPSADAGLANLSLSDGLLTPAFETGITSYTASVANSITSISVNPLLHDTTASVQVNGIMATSGMSSAAVPLSVGVNIINVVVTAQDGIATTTYSLSVTRQLSADAGLANLSLSDGLLAPAFETGVTGYTASVANSITSISVTPLLHDTTARVQVNGTAVGPGMSSSAIPLNVGVNIINVLVTAQDSVATITYSLSVTRLSADAGLSNLSLSDGSLAPAFETGVTNYTALVGNSVMSISVTPLLHDTTASVQVNGVITTSGMSSEAVPLNVGVNIINIVVTAQDGITTVTYSLSVTRQPSADAGLANLSLSNSSLTPSFETGLISYTASVTNNSANHIIYTLGDSITANGGYQSSLDSVFNDAFTLVNLGVPGDRTPGMINRFSTVTGIPADYVIVLGGINDIAFNTAATQIEANLATIYANAHNAGMKVIAMTVTPWKGSTNWTAARQAVQDDVNAWIASTADVDYVIDSYAALSDPADPQQMLPLYDSGDHLHPSLAGQLKIGATIYNSAAIIPKTDLLQSNAATIVTPTANNANATIQVNDVVVPSGTSSATVPLIMGNNIIATKVTAEDGTTTKTYTINLSRKPSSNADLSSIIINSGGNLLSPVFAGNVTNYNAVVSAADATVAVFPVALKSGTTIKINGHAFLSKGVPVKFPVSQNLAIRIDTKAEDGVASRTYFINVTKATPMSSNATLSVLKLSPSSSLKAVSGPDYQDYTTAVSNSEASVQVMPTSQDSTAVILVNGVQVASGASSAAIPLSVGANVITTVVIAQDGVTQKIYAITVTRAASNNAVLAILKVTPSTTLTVVTGADFKDFITTVPNSESSVQITPTAQDITASIKVNGVAVASGTASASIPLSVGDNVINTVITAQDGVNQRNYSIKFTRQPPAGVALLYTEKAVPVLDNSLRVHQNVSPNGDGNSDVLVIDGIAAYPDNKVQIMNRSGVLVYEVKGYDNTTRVFDGHASTNGKLQQAGTYLYSLEYKDGNETKYKSGFIVLKY